MYNGIGLRTARGSGTNGCANNHCCTASVLMPPTLPPSPPPSRSRSDDRLDEPALGANIAVLTAKHGCGFLLWPTNSTLPDGSPYGYSVGTSKAAIKEDLLQMFVDSANAAGVGYGFYYSIMKSFYLCHSFSGTNSCTKQRRPSAERLAKQSSSMHATSTAHDAQQGTQPGEQNLQNV